MSLALEGKNALVTGSSRGIGRAIAERFAANGAAVVINYAGSRQSAQEIVKQVVAKGAKAVAIEANVSKAAEVQRLFNEAEKALGPLDIVVANAGVYLSKPLIESTEEDYNHVFDINTKGVFFTLQEAPVAFGMAVASSSFPRAAPSCPSLMHRFILEVKGQ